MIADGNSIGIFVNGRLNAHHVDSQRLFSRGHIVLQQHDPNTRVESLRN